MKTYYAYDLESIVAIQGEEHRIIGGQIRLDHIPKEGTLEVRGFVEGSDASNLTANQFYCNYRKDTLYREANRIVYFYKGRSGQTVYCSYIAIGSPVTADDMNEINDFMSSTNKKFVQQETAQSNLNIKFNALEENTKVYLRNHNTNPDSHMDIRDDIANFKADNAAQHIQMRSDFNSALSMHNINVNAHESIRKSIADLQDDFELYKQTVPPLISNSITEHNTDINAHSFIQQLIANETTARAADISALENALTNHDANHSAHAFIRGLITTEESARILADDTLDGKITAEQSARQSADNSLDGKISAEETARISADDELRDLITAGGSSQAIDISELRQSIADEISARQSADSTLQQAITAEQTARIAGLSALEEKIGDSAQVQLNTFTLAVNAWQSDQSEGSVYIYYADISADITADDYAEINFTRGCLSVVADANICPSGETLAGKIRIFAEKVPTADISGQFLIMKGGS